MRLFVLHLPGKSQTGECARVSASQCCQSCLCPARGSDPRACQPKLLPSPPPPNCRIFLLQSSRPQASLPLCQSTCFIHPRRPLRPRRPPAAGRLPSPSVPSLAAFVSRPPDAPGVRRAPPRCWCGSAQERPLAHTTPRPPPLLASPAVDRPRASTSAAQLHLLAAQHPHTS